MREHRRRVLGIAVTFRHATCVVALLAIAAGGVPAMAKPPPSAAQPSAPQLRDKAYDAFQAKKYPEAMRLIDQAIALDPDGLEPLKLKAYIAGHAGDQKLAVGIADAYLARDPDDGEMHDLRGTARYFLGDPDGALADYVRAYGLDYRNANFFKNYMDLLNEKKQFERINDVYARYLQLRKESSGEMEELSDIPFYASLAAMAEKNHPKALALLNEALRISPDFAGYYINRAGVYGDMKDYTRAMADYARAIQWTPKDPKIYYNRGTMFLEMDADAEALRDFLTARGLGDDGADNWFNIGAAYDHLGQNKEALAAYDEALKRNPADARIKINRATVLRELGRDGEAKSDEGDVLRQLPANDAAGVYFNQSTAKMAAKDYRGAIELLQKFIGMRPGYAPAWGRLGAAYEETGERQKALDAFNTAIKLQPDEADHYLNRGLLYVRLGDQLSARKDYEKAFALKPADLDAYERIAMTYVHTDQPAEARKYFSRMELAGAASSDYFVNYSAFLLGEGDTAKALQIATLGAAKFPGNSELLTNLANAQGDSKQWDAAVATYKRAIAIAPTDASAYYNLANTLAFGMKKPAQAIEWYRHAIRIDPTLHAAWLNLASAYRDAGDTANSDRTVAEVTEKFPDRYEAVYNRAGFFMLNGSAAKAQRDYATALTRMDRLLASSPDLLTADLADLKGSRAYALYHLGQLQQSAAAYAEVLALKPSATEVRRNYGFVLLDLGRLPDAQKEFAQAFAEDPDEVDAWLGQIASHYLMGDHVSVAEFKKQFARRFSGTYTLNLNLLQDLRKESYWYSERFHKIWKSLITNR